jgi:putative restriction endonuclease
MTGDPVRGRFDKLNVWGRGGQRAPHKPLLVLYALGRWGRGEAGDIPFREVDADLTGLLKEFGPPRQSYHPEYPFWRLQNDGVWAVHAAGPLTPRQSSTDAKKSDLLAKDAAGGFSPEVRAALRADPRLVTEVAARLLENHFPESIRPDILSAVGLTPGADGAATRKRGPQFRQRVLVAYEYRCAVCGFDVRLGSVSIALDAAHIRWFQAGGPDHESNGLALCVLHHKTFDLGAFTVSRDGVLLVSDQAHGTEGFHEALLSRHGKPVRPPRSDRSGSLLRSPSTGTPGRSSRGRRGRCRDADTSARGSGRGKRSDSDTTCGFAPPSRWSSSRSRLKRAAFPAWPPPRPGTALWMCIDRGQG